MSFYYERKFLQFFVFEIFTQNQKTIYYWLNFVIFYSVKHFILIIIEENFNNNFLYLSIVLSIHLIKHLSKKHFNFKIFFKLYNKILKKFLISWSNKYIMFSSEIRL